MFIQKLKLVAATAVVLVALGAGGLAWRAGGVAVAQDKPRTAKPRTEVEALRREVELLRLNLEVVLEKVRSQETELRQLRAKAKTRVEYRTVVNEYATFLRKARVAVPDAVKQAEDAVRALRAARDPEARRRATDALENALKALRGQVKPGTDAAPGGR